MVRGGSRTTDGRDSSSEWTRALADSVSLHASPIAQKVFGAAGPPTNIPTSAPSHIVAVRTSDAKLGMYTYWKPRSMDIDTSRPIQHELYDYTTPSGVQELDNQAGRSPRQAALQGLLDHEVLPELRAPLPDFLDDAQQQGLANMNELALLFSSGARSALDVSCYVPGPQSVSGDRTDL